MPKPWRSNWPPPRKTRTPTTPVNPGTGLRGWLRRHPKVWVTSAITALLLAFLAVGRDIVVSELVKPDAVADGIRDLQHQPVVELVRVQRYAVDVTGPYVDPSGATLGPRDETAVQDISAPQAQQVLARVEATAVPIRHATWHVVLRGNRRRGVRIVDVRPVRLARKPPASGTLFLVPSQGAEDAQLMGLDTGTLS